MASSRNRFSNSKSLISYSKEHIGVVSMFDIPSVVISKIQNNELLTANDFPGYDIPDNLRSPATFTIQSIYISSHFRDSISLIYALRTNSYVKEITFSFNTKNLPMLIRENNTLTKINCLQRCDFSLIVPSISIIEALEKNTTIEGLFLSMPDSYNINLHELDEFDRTFISTRAKDKFFEDVDMILKRNILKKKMEALILSVKREIFIPDDIYMLAHEKFIQMGFC